MKGASSAGVQRQIFHYHLRGFVQSRGQTRLYHDITCTKAARKLTRDIHLGATVDLP